MGAAGTPLAATSGTDRSLYDGWGVSGQINYDLSDMFSVTSITGYRSFSTTFDSDDDLSPASVGFGKNDLTNWSFSQELRLNVKPTDSINLTLGGYYFKQKSVYDSLQDIRYVRRLPAPVPSARSDLGRCQGGLRARLVGTDPQPHAQRWCTLHRRDEGPDLFPPEL